MAYKPLSQNEYVIVSKTIYEERGLSGGLAESMFLAYKGRALALDAPEFEIFKESEIERRAALLKKQSEENNQLNSELAPMDFLRKLEDLSRNEKLNAEPGNCYEWFYGDESLLDARHKSLRLKFFNSERYRKQVLRSYLEDGILVEDQLGDTQKIGEIIRSFHRKYPGTRQGIISSYEIFFGDPTGFSYSTAMAREAFHNDVSVRQLFLQERQLPKEWGIDEIKNYLKEDALKTGSATVEQIELWERVYSVK